MLIGLTGGIACGKSTVAQVFEKRGFEILDTDHIAHDCLAPGGACEADVLRAFGPEILDLEGRIDRRILGEIVFGDRAKRKVLEDILHPVIRSTWRGWAQSKKEQKKDGCVVIPLLFEVGAVDGWSAVVCVSAPEAAVVQRLMARGHTEKEARERISAQLPIEEKEARADYTIYNSGTIEELKEKTERLINRLVGEGDYHG